MTAQTSASNSELRPAAASSEPLRALGADGRLVAPPADADWALPVKEVESEAGRAALRKLYRALVVGGRLSEALPRAMARGDVGFVAPEDGVDRAAAAAVAALDSDDWYFPSLREKSAILTKGVPTLAYVHQLFGNAEDRCRGRQAPLGIAFADARVASVSALPGTHLGHAVGAAWAAKTRGDSAVALASCRGEEVAAADFHNALNFAGVFKAPVVFLVASTSEGTERLANDAVFERAVAYGIPSMRVDGGDPVAVFLATRGAALRARSGAGAVLIEAVGTPSDDGHASKLAAYLHAAGAWTDTDDGLEAVATVEIEEALRVARATPRPAPDVLFEDVFAELPWHLQEQREQARAARGARGSRGPSAGS